MRINGSTFTAAALLALFVQAPGPGMCAPPAETLVVDLATLNLSGLQPELGATAQPVTTESGPGLRLSVPASDSTPGVALTIPTGMQDLSAFTQIFVRVRNSGGAEATVACRAENPDAHGVENCTLGTLTLAPGQSGTVRVNIRRKKPDWVKVNLFGMRGYPWSGPLGIERAPRHLVDPAHIVRLYIYVQRPDGEREIDIQRISAVGSFVPLSPLLADSARFFPFIDRFGQYMHADWPGKVHSLAELQASIRIEEQDLAAHPGPADWDKYGGWQGGPQLQASGFFRTAKYEGKWWLVDPEGHIFFSQGIDCVSDGGYDTPVADRDGWFEDLPARDSGFANCYRKSEVALHGDFSGRSMLSFDFGRADLMRKYGADWKVRFAAMTHRRLRSWGLNSICCWSSPDIYLQDKTPYTATVDFDSPPLEGSQGYWGKFRDVFDPKFRSGVRSAIKSRTARSAGDPWCLGYFVDNEISWGGQDISLALGTLASPAGQTAKKVLIGDLRKKYGTIDKLNSAWGGAYASWEALLNGAATPDTVKAHADLLEFQIKTARTYFETIRAALREYCPNQLYLGCRFAWVNAPVVEEAARYCDVVSYNIYHLDISDFRFPARADVPLIIGEFHMGALDRGMFHTGLVSVASQQERAEAYTNYVQSVLRNPQFVGCAWFQFRDESNTGRPYDDENYQIGFVDIADTPYVETIQAAREIGDNLYRYRLGAK